MSLYQDRQIKGFLLFLTLFALLFVGTATVLTIYQVNDAEVLWLKHDEAVSSSLLEQGVPKEVVAVAFTNTDISDDGRSLLAAAGLGKQSESSMRPYFNQFQRSAFCTMLCTVLFFLFVLAIGIFIFFWKRKRLYQQADKILLNYINGDYSCHLPQNYEGAIYQVFSSIEQLATMLQSKNETERKAKEFLKDTISDISHQLKTPLAALTMYQEIIESEPENAETVKQFAAKIGISLKRMEQLILSMLKITRLDTGNIIFEKKSCRVSELIAHSVNDLTTRAKSESKQIQIDGDGEQQLICDMEWTGEAIGNIVKNALDHTQAGGIVRITWERTPAMFRIFISDNGNGIVPEDIYHIFKRFYRSKHSLDTQGIGLGLPLAKSIIEGQNGVTKTRKAVTTYVSDKTIEKIIKLLRCAFKQAVRWEIIARNPFDNVILPKTEYAKRDIWTADMIRLALDKCTDSKLYVAMNLSFACSLRMGEILGLTWENVHISDEDIAADNAYVYIDKELTRASKRAIETLGEKDIYYIFTPLMPNTSTRIILKKPKTDSSIRKVWLPKTLAYILREWKKSQDELKGFLGDEYQDFDLVVALPNGRPCEDRIILKEFAKLREDAGLPKVVFHSLRHSSTTYKLKLNHGDLKATQGDTGHAEIDMITSIYAHILDEDRKVNAQKFETAFYAKPDLRNVRPPEEPAKSEPATLDLESLVEQLQKSPELASALAALIAAQAPAK